MLNSLAQKIIEDMAHTYDAIAEPFATSRKKPWPELLTLMDMINQISLMSQVNPEIKQIKVLDIGCGNGRVAEIAQQCKVNYTGIDLSEKLIQLAKQTYPEQTFVVGSMVNLPFPDKQFDIVVAIASLQHIPSAKLRLRSLQEMRRVTKPGGKLFMTNWNLFQPKWERYFVPDLDPGDAMVPWKNSQGKILAQRYYHGFTDAELKQLLLDSGWQLQDQCFSEKQRNIVSIAKTPSSLYTTFQ